MRDPNPPTPGIGALAGALTSRTGAPRPGHSRCGSDAVYNSDSAESASPPVPDGGPGILTAGPAAPDISCLEFSPLKLRIISTPQRSASGDRRCRLRLGLGRNR
jgi:hypothetical protein